MRWNLLISILAALAISNSAFAQLDPFLFTSRAQSSPEYDWKKIENEFVEVIYPEGWESVAQRSAYFVERYANVVGLSLGIEKPKKFPLILRPDMALPNGFVTLAPRRSEWFINQSFSPFIGGLDFIDALAVHEYRHVNQFDYSKRSINRGGYLLFGEFGLALLNAIGMPRWYYEGDAVWTETKYTDGGRGRSPRFAARLKALILSNQLPSYDEFVGGTFTTSYPNHYVYGYYLVSRAYRLYGKDFWQKVFAEVTSFSISPYKIYRAFKEVSGVSFEKFYYDTFEELKKDWTLKGEKLSEVKTPNFVQRRFPIKDGDTLYYLERKLNSFWTLKKEGSEEEIKELPVNPDLSKVDIRGGKLAYTQVLPGLRYSYKTSSDLFVYSIKEDEVNRWSDGFRAFHPQWGENYLFALRKLKDNKFVIIRSVDGKKWESFSFPLGVPLEFSPITDQKLAVIFQNEMGEKSIAHFDLQSNQAKRLVPFARKNLFSLRAFGESLYFEADYKDNVQILKLDTSTKGLYTCSNEVLMARNPYLDQTKLKFVSMTGDGDVLNTSTGCQKVSSKYWKEGASALSMTSFGEAEPVKLKPSELKTIEVEEVNTFARGLAPNSWSFIGGRGYQLQFNGSNLLGDFSYNFAIGEDAEEEAPFGNLSFSYNKYFLTASLYADYEERNTILSTREGRQEWDELEYGLALKAPLTWASGLYVGSFSIGGNIGKLDVSNLSGIFEYRPDDEVLDVLGGELTFSYLKRLTFQQIFPRYGFTGRFFYRTIDSDRREEYGTDLTFGKASLFLPGFFENHGIKITGTYESQDAGVNNYRHEPVEDLISSYVFSRGFSYSYVDEYIKTTIDYALPLINSDLNFWNYHYLKRLRLNLFYDRTDFDVIGLKGDLQSYGAELGFDATWFRRFPLAYGVRYSWKVDSDQVFDFFLGTSLSF